MLAKFNTRRAPLSCTSTNAWLAEQQQYLPARRRLPSLQQFCGALLTFLLMLSFLRPILTIERRGRVPDPRPHLSLALRSFFSRLASFTNGASRVFSLGAVCKDAGFPPQSYTF